MQLLGKDLVLWRDSDNKWSCFEDCCPLLPPLVSGGRLQVQLYLQWSDTC
ncbi:MAG: hypothetical protein MET45_02365 [Nostoc sp. LLA-1]|nr:hypothetical protein [Cyanocohniella sp. LLY]